MNKIIFFIFFVLGFFFLNFSNVFGINYLYDDFTSINTNTWNFYPNGGNIEITSDGMLLSIDYSSFPYLISKNNIFPIEDDFVLDIRFKYVSNGSMGDGISVGFTGPDGSFFEQFQLWKDESHGLFLAYHDLNTDIYNLCNNLGSTNASTPIIYSYLSLSDDWHILRIEKDNSKYNVYIDPGINNDNPIFTSNNNQCTPKHILLGGIYTAGNYDWNDLLINNVSVYNSIVEPTPTPVLTSKSKIIIIPGFGASWNSEAIVYNNTVDNDQWRMTPFVKNYDGLIDALKQNNLEENEDYYVWNYDWRKPLKDIVTDLNNFINQKIKPGEKVVLIGHSLGGLTARIWAEDNKNDLRLDKVIALGSPNLGSVDSYEAWNGGQISDLSKFSSIAFKILLELKGLTTKTNMEAVRTYIPSVKDLLPTFNFIKKEGVVLSNDKLETKNDFLENKNNSNINSEINLKLFAGNGFKTTDSINLKKNNIFDKVLGVWPDGRINNFIYSDSGDGTVLVKSVNYGKSDFVEVDSNHGDIVDKTINQVMMEVGLSQVEAVGKSEDYRNNLVFFVGSPVKYSVKCDNDSPVLENDGFVVIKNKNYKICTMNMAATGDGMVHIVSGNTNDNNWSYLEKNIKTGEIDSIKIDPKNGQIIDDKNNILFLKSLIREDINSLLVLNKNNKDLREALRSLDKNQPKQLIKNMFDFREKNEDRKISQKIIDNATIWLSFLNKCSKNEALNDFKTVNNYRDLIESLTTNRKNLRINVNMAIDYQKIIDLLEINQKEIQKNNYSKVCGRNFLILNYGKGIQKWLLEDSDL